MIKIERGLLVAGVKLCALLVILFSAFGIIGPALISANSYILVAVGFGWMIMSVIACIWLIGQLIGYFTGEDDV
jgi:hypothetical protein